MNGGEFVSGFCNEMSSILGFAGWVITLIKVAMPLLIIVFGILDFGKAIVGSDEKVIKKSAQSLGIRIVAGLVIFFIPSIIIWLFGLVYTYNNSADNFKKCQDCLLSPWKCNETQDKSGY